MKVSGTKKVKVKEGLEYIAGVAELDQNYFDWPWSTDQWNQLKTLELRDDYLLLVLVDDDEQILAMILFHKLPDCNHLLKILVSPIHRKKGYAHKLLIDALNLLGSAPVYLEVAVDNIAAIEFYKKSGFKELVLKKGFYRDGSDALAMQLKRK